MPASAPRSARASARAVAALGVAAALSCGVVACRPADARPLTPAQRTAIADTIARQVIAACDLRGPNVVARLMSLYPAAGSVVSASGGHVTTTHDSLEAAVRTFWDNVGHNMRDPTWQWTSMRIDVLAPNAAVMTATYRIPHHTPAGLPHVVGGAWTAVFERRGARWVIVHEHLSDAGNP